MQQNRKRVVSNELRVSESELLTIQTKVTALENFIEQLRKRQKETQMQLENVESMLQEKEQEKEQLASDLQRKNTAYEECVRELNASRSGCEDAKQRK